MVSINDFNEVKDCIYKGEHYSVRDNGAIMRHQREGMRVRRDDNVWTWGKPNDKTGYMDFCGQAVHRIVAYAFYGNPPTEQHVVDHIDTNRRNNRPENLRWLTKLENILNNEITRKKVELICGSIKAFLENPSLLYNHEMDDRNFSWMRRVTREEAQNCLENWENWFKTTIPNTDNKKEKKYLDDRIYRKPQPNFKRDIPNPSQKSIIIAPELPKEKEYKITRSLTPNAVQANWKIPSEFPCCPKEPTNNPLKEYQLNLKVDSLFCKNNLYSSYVLESAITDEGNALWVMTQSNGDSMKPWALTKIIYQNNIFIHESKGTFYENKGAQKYFILAQGKEWTGGEVFDDYC